MIVTDDAFDELLDRVERLAEETPARAPQGFRDEPSDDDPVVLRRDQFALAVDRAVTNVVARATDRRVWYAQTLRRFGCRLHFFRSAGLVYLVACIDSDEEDDDIEAHST